MNSNPTLHIVLDLSEINAILAVLQELPAKTCNPLSEKIRQQAIPQIEALNTQEVSEPVAE